MLVVLITTSIVQTLNQTGIVTPHLPVSRSRASTLLLVAVESGLKTFTTQD
jgi:hypothetical protein